MSPKKALPLHYWHVRLDALEEISVVLISRLVFEVAVNSGSIQTDVSYRYTQIGPCRAGNYLAQTCSLSELDAFQNP